MNQASAVFLSFERGPWVLFFLRLALLSRGNPVRPGPIRKEALILSLYTQTNLLLNASHYGPDFGADHCLVKTLLRSQWHLFGRIYNDLLRENVDVP